jgi:O-antigen ligase
MEILIFFACATVCVWALVGIRVIGGLNFRLLPLAGMGVLITECVFGYNFFNFQAGPLPLTLDRIVLLGLLGSWGIQYLRQRERLHAFNAVDWTIIAILGFLLLNVLTHDWKYKNSLPVSRLLFFYLLPSALYFVMRFAKIGAAELKLISLSFAGLAVYLAITAIAETREINSLVFPRYIMEPGEFYGRGRGPLLNPVINGMLMSVGCCCLWMGWANGKTNHRILIVALTGLISLGIFFTYTRSVWLAFVACAALFIFYPADRKTKSWLWLTSIILLVFSFPFVGEKLFSFKRDKAVTQTQMELSAKLRPMFIEVAGLMFQDRPILGCGFGHYAREKYAYLKDAHARQPLVMTRMYMQHNVLLAYLTETGLLGLGFLLAMITAMTRQAWKLWQDRNFDLPIRLFGLLSIAVLLNYGINGMFHDVSIIPLCNLLLFFAIAIVNNLSTVDLAIPVELESYTAPAFGPQKALSHC